MESIVALDIETTGLDTKNDAIIEVGAVRFNNRRVESEWSTLIHPGKRIPPFITQLTGISDQMVLDAPKINDVLPDITSFVGQSPVLGHNVRFDLSFMRRHGILHSNEALDTYELAAVLLPEARRYNLGSLAQTLGIMLPATHRALDDAKVTRAVYQRLYEEAKNLPINLLAEIISLSQSLEWSARWTLKKVLQEQSHKPIPPKASKNKIQSPAFKVNKAESKTSLLKTEDHCPLDPEEVSSILEFGGVFSKFFPNYENRSQQISMVQAVTRAISEQGHLMVEAGTGIGKSIAYLVPAALWSTKNNSRVVISTNTINLQDQLINKDIPDLRQAMDLDLNAAILKGRSNYICPRRLETLRRHGPRNIEEMRVLAKVLVWLLSTESGDRTEINLNGPAENSVWTRISAEDEGCSLENCLKTTGGTCPFYRARKNAQTAHLLIVNHALLLSDIATGNRILPDYDCLIVDEAHHLEDATTDSLSFRITRKDVERLLRELGGPKTGALGWLLEASSDVLSPADNASLTKIVNDITNKTFQLENLVRKFFISVDKFLAEQREGTSLGPYTHQERILPATRTQPAWVEVEIAWDEAESALQSAQEDLVKLLQGLADLLDGFAEDDEEIFSLLSNILRRLKEFNDHINGLVFDPDPERIYWAELNPSGRRLSLHSAPLHIGPLMQKYLWHEKSCVILTSATLTTAGEFDYLRERLYAEDADELAVGSPFDYETSTLLYIPNDIPEPGDYRGHQHTVEKALINLCKVSHGRTLALFTSYKQLKRTSRAITPVLSKADILVYEQGQGASPHSLLESFRSAERAVLLGTRSFWEGVDIPGEALSVLVIVRLPFDVPSDPIVAARAETFEDPFYQYTLPEAILRFRQGFGRLIRTQEDRGVVVILDRRVLSKQYGRSFIDSLPPSSVRVAPLSNLPNSAKKWLNL